MTVEELIAALSVYPSETTVVVDCEEHGTSDRIKVKTYDSQPYSVFLDTSGG